MSLDLDGYRRDAEAFCAAIHREYYLHLAGHKDALELERIYAEHPRLFGREQVEALRALAETTEGDEGRRRRYLLHLALDGYLGRECRREAEELARLEASVEVTGPDGDRIPYRGIALAQANEGDAGRRARLEAERESVLVERLNPLHREALEHEHRLCRELGWASYADAYSDLRGIDLRALYGRTAAFLESTAAAYPEVMAPELERQGVPPLGELWRSDLPRFLRASELDGHFPEDRMLAVFTETLAGLGIDPAGQPNVTLDTEQRPTKSPRAFCATPRVPEEIYLVVAPVGGREDFAALFHEGGHAQHYAHVDATLPFEFRHLGDNSVTESFAFLLEHLVEDPAWLRERMGVPDPEEVVAHARAVKLHFLRRYAAKLAYEIELHGPDPDLDAMPARYVALLGDATQVRLTSTSWLADVDEGFYVACYLRAWALETHWRRALEERWGDRWFAVSEAGEWLRSLWSQGQRLGADELLAERLGQELDFGVLAERLTS